MKKSNRLLELSGARVYTGAVRLYSKTGWLHKGPGGEEVIVNEEEQSEAVNQDENEVNGLD